MNLIPRCLRKREREVGILLYRRFRNYLILSISLEQMLLWVLIGLEEM